MLKYGPNVMFSLASLRLRDFALKKTINAKAQGRQGTKGRTDRSDFRDNKVELGPYFKNLTFD
jgi:hypothetical protein